MSSCPPASSALLLAVGASLGAAQSSLPAASTVDAGDSILQDSAFGVAAAVSNGWLVVGADQTVAGSEGEIHLFRRIGGAIFQTEDSESGAAQGDAFGSAVDVDGTGIVPVVIAGAPRNAAQTVGGGRAYVYEFTGGALQLYATLEPSAPQQNSAFGTAVATSVDVFAVGQPSTAVGEVSVWDRSQGSLTSLSKLLAFDGANGDQFGSALALDQSLLAVGSPLHDAQGSDAGAVYLFEQPFAGASFSPLIAPPTPLIDTAKVLASDGDASDQFGAALALAGDLLIVGAPGKGPGAAYVFRRAGGGAFVEEAALTVSGLPPNAGFGTSVAVAEGRVVIGANRALTGGLETGAGFVFEESSPESGQWDLVWQLEPTDAVAGDFVGAASAVDGEIVVLGAPRASAVNSGGFSVDDAGLAQVFDVSEGFCSLDLLAKPTGGRADRFGSSVDYDGLTAVVGSPFDDDGASDAGSVSVLRRNGFTWDHEQLLTPNAAQAGTRFGSSVDIDGNRLGVGAPASPQDFFTAGSVSLWERSSSLDPFASVTELSAPEPEAGDAFGAAVVLDGDRLTVGGPGTAAGRGIVHGFVEDAVPGTWVHRQTLGGYEPDSIDEAFGFAMKTEGDRVIIGAPGSDVAAMDAGSVTLGEWRQAAVLDRELMDQTDVGLAGALDPLDQFGLNSVEPIADLDGNGVPDLAIGALFDDDAGNDAGAVYLVRIDGDGNALSHTKISEGLSGFSGVLDSGDLFGGGLAWGQFDQDADMELAVGAVGDSAGGSDTGAVWVLNFDPSWNVSSFWRIDSSDLSIPLDPGESFGGSVENLGDVDRNGVEDLAVAATKSDVAGNDAGVVRTLLLGPSENVLSDLRFDTVGFGLGSSDGELFGTAVRNIGDLDGDGVNDLAVGSFAYSDQFGDDTGAVYVFRVLAPTGSLSFLARIAEGESGFTGELDDGVQFGAGIAGPGDLDGDGVPDIIVSANQDNEAPEGTGALWMLFLETDGTVRASEKVSGAQGSLGPFESTRFGRSLATLGDIDGDGRLEVAAGARDLPDRFGEVWTLDIGPGWGTTQQVLTASAAAAGDRFGFAVDVDGSTAVVGAPGDDDSGPQSGSVVVFEEIDGSFVETGVLEPDDAAAGLGFGSSVLLSGDVLLVGAPGGLGVPPGLGASYLFERLGPGFPFVQINRIDASDGGEPGDAFGQSLALSGSTVLVGAPDWDATNVDQGTVYAYSLSSVSCPTLVATADYVSLAVGGDQELFLKAGPEYGATLHAYVVLVSLTTFPPTPVAPGVILPLTADALALASLSGVNQPPFIDTFGFLDENGEAEARIALPDTLPASLLGTTLYAAYLVLGPIPSGTPVFASEAVGVELVD